MKNYKVSVVSYPNRSNYVLRWTDPVTAKAKTQDSGIPNDGRKRSRSKAEKKAGELEEKLKTGAAWHQRRVTWEDFTDKFLTDVQERLRENTRRIYATALDSFGDLVSPSHLDVITTEEIRRFRKRLEAKGLSDATIRNYLRHLKAALNWAVREGVLQSVPHFTAARSSGAIGDEAKGRPLSACEFNAMLKAVRAVVKPAQEKDRHAIEKSWKRLLHGLRLSGLRIAEACALSWDDTEDAHLVRDAKGRLAIFFPAHRNKNGKVQTVPVTPTFQRFLDSVPAEERVGRVFQVVRDSGRPWSMRDPLPIGKKVAAFGKQAGVIVSERKGKARYASAHDLRRTFGKEWALKVKPALLMKLMRHASITTTMKYYALLDTETVADELWNTVAKK